MRIRTMIVLSLLLGGHLSAQTRPATTLPTDPALLKDFNNATAQARDCKPDAQYHKLSDVIDIRVENGVLRLTPMIAAENRYIRLELDDLPGITWYNANQESAATLRNVCPKATGFSFIELASSAGSMAIHMSETTASQRVTCAIGQDVSGSGGERRIGLYLTRDDGRGKVLSKTEYTGANLEELRRKNPAADEHLWPLLHRVGQDHLLMANPQAAW